MTGTPTKSIKISDRAANYLESLIISGIALAEKTIDRECETSCNATLEHLHSLMKIMLEQTIIIQDINSIHGDSNPSRATEQPAPSQRF